MHEDSGKLANAHKLRGRLAKIANAWVRRSKFIQMVPLISSPGNAFQPFRRAVIAPLEMDPQTSGNITARKTEYVSCWRFIYSGQSLLRPELTRRPADGRRKPTQLTTWSTGTSKQMNCSKQFCRNPQGNTSAAGSIRQTKMNSSTAMFAFQGRWNGPSILLQSGTRFFS